MGITRCLSRETAFVEEDHVSLVPVPIVGGSAPYLVDSAPAPELADGDSRGAEESKSSNSGPQEAAVDMWMVGALLYEAFFGKDPVLLPGKDHVEVRHQTCIT